MNRIHITVNQNQIQIHPRRIEKSAKVILDALGYTDVELSIMIVDDEEMARLNWEYRRIDSTTDVLSFPMREGEFGDICPELIGDVVISAPTAHNMSREHHCSLQDILDLLLVHGVLHLEGYDHEQSDEEARSMDTKTMNLLKKLGYSQSAFQWYLATDSSGK